MRAQFYFFYLGSCVELLLGGNDLLDVGAAEPVGGGVLDIYGAQPITGTGTFQIKK